MSDADDVLRLLERARAGSPEAAAELVRRYEPLVRLAVRSRLRDRRLRRTLDSLDVCQSVFGRFFVQVTVGKVELSGPDDLLAYLVTLARNRLRDHARREYAEKRDVGLLVGGEALEAVRAGGASPSRLTAGRELLEEVRRRLPEHERYLAEQRAAGREWNDLAAELNAGAQALRKRLERALARVVQSLGLDGPDG